MRNPNLNWIGNFGFREISATEVAVLPGYLSYNLLKHQRQKEKKGRIPNLMQPGPSALIGIE